MAANIPTAPITRATPEMAALLTTLVSKKIVSTLRTGRGWLPAKGVTYEAYRNGTDDSYALASYSDLPLADADLTDYVLQEGITPTTVEAFPSDVNTFSTTEYARIVTYTDEQVRTNPHGFAGIVADKVSNAALDLLDAKAGLIWGGYSAAGVPKFSPETATGGDAAAANPLVTTAVVKAVTTLEMLGVQRLDGAAFGCLIRPDVAATLMLEAGELGWVDATKYAGPERLMTGEIGQYRGVRFFSLSRIPAAVAVVPSYFFGLEALAFADLGSLRVEHVSPTPSITDPLGQRGAAGFRVRGGGMLLHDLKPGTDEKQHRVVVCESTPTVTVAA
jgi:N4-gp56 family major capsid protein